MVSAFVPGDAPVLAIPSSREKTTSASGSLVTPEDRLQELGLVLPNVNSPVGSYRMARRFGSSLFVSGHGAFRDGVPLHRGKLGQSFTTEQGAAAAREVMLHLLATVKNEVDDLSRVRFVKVVVLVNSTPDYTEQHLVANGATDLLVEVFGRDGQPARTAVGVASLPLGFAVEIEAQLHLPSPGDVREPSGIGTELL